MQDFHLQGWTFRYDSHRTQEFYEAITLADTPFVRNFLENRDSFPAELSGLLQIMDGVFISEEIGAPKPHQEFFSHCLERIEEKDKDKIILIGDSLTSDIKGGAMAGIVTCWYRPKSSTNNSQYRPDYEISNLHEIVQILEEKETKR